MKAWTLGMVILLAVALGIYLGIVRGLLFGTTLPEESSMAAFIPSDAMYYARMASDFSMGEILDFGYYNILGPVSLIKLMRLNFDLIFLTYVMGFVIALRELGCHAGIRPGMFGFLLLANPLVLINLVSPNKEISAVLAVLFIIVYINSGRFSHASAGIGFAIISKLEFLTLLLCFLGVRKFLPRKRAIILLLLSVLASYFYGLISEVGGRDQILMQGQVEESFGLLVTLHDLGREYYLFMLIAIPRVVIGVMEGTIVLLRGYSGDLILMVPIAWSGIMFVAVSLSVVRKKTLRLGDDAVFLFFLLILLVSLVPFPQHRYLLPIYPLLLYFMLRRRSFREGAVASLNVRRDELSKAHG